MSNSTYKGLTIDEFYDNQDEGLRKHIGKIINSDMETEDKVDIIFKLINGARGVPSSAPMEITNPFFVEVDTQGVIPV
jgi:hypothetical protein